MNETNNSNDLSELKDQIERPSHILGLVQRHNLPASDIEKITGSSFDERERQAKALVEAHKKQSEQDKHAQEQRDMIERMNAETKEYDDYKHNRKGLWSK